MGCLLTPSMSPSFPRAKYTYLLATSQSQARPSFDHRPPPSQSKSPMPPKTSPTGFICPKVNEYLGQVHLSSLIHVVRKFKVISEVSFKVFGCKI